MKKSKVCFLILLALAVSTSSLNQQAIAYRFSGKISKNHSKIERLIEKGRYNEALKRINNILEDNPNDYNARAYLGAIYSDQFKLDAATREFHKVLKQDPENAAAHNGLGMVYYRRTASSDMNYRKQIPQLLNKAFKEFFYATKKAPDFYQAYSNAGKMLFELGRIEEAEMYLQKALSLKPDYSEAVEVYGRVLFSKNKVDAAISNYNKAIELNSKNSSAYYHLGEALIAKGQYSEAIHRLQTSLYLFPNSAPVHNMLGKAYEMQENEAAAISEYKKACLIKPEYTAPYLSLAEIYKARGDEEIAISELRNALAVNPDFYEARAKIAEISLNIGKVDQTISNYNKLLNTPNYKNIALIGLAKAYFLKAQQSGISLSEYNFIEIEENLKKAISYDPNNLELYLALLRLSKASLNEKDSQLYLSRIIEQSKDNRIDNIIKGEARLTFNEFNSAEVEFIKAINNTRSSEELVKLADIFIINRAYSAAKIALNRVIAKTPNNPKAKRALERIKRNEQQAISKERIARGFARSGQKIAAIEAYKDALSLNPYRINAQFNIAYLYEKEGYYYNALEHYKAYVNLADISNDIAKYRTKINRLERKIQKMKQKDKPIKIYSGS